MHLRLLCQEILSTTETDGDVSFVSLIIFLTKKNISFFLNVKIVEAPKTYSSLSSFKSFQPSFFISFILFRFVYFVLQFKKKKQKTLRNTPRNHENKNECVGRESVCRGNADLLGLRLINI